MRSIAEQLNILFGYDFTDADNKAVLKTVVSRVLDEREPKVEPKRERDEPLKLPPKKAPRTEEKKTPAKEESDDGEGDEEDEEDEEGNDDSESEEKPKRYSIFVGRAEWPGDVLQCP